MFSMLTAKYWSPTNNCFPSIKLTLSFPFGNPLTNNIQSVFLQSAWVAKLHLLCQTGQWPTIGSKEGNIVIQVWRQTIRCWRDGRDPKTILKSLWWTKFIPSQYKLLLELFIAPLEEVVLYSEEKTIVCILLGTHSLKNADLSCDAS